MGDDTPESGGIFIPLQRHKNAPGRRRNIGIWELEAEELGLSPAAIKDKMRKTRRRHAADLNVPVHHLEVLGWTVDNMGHSYVQAKARGRCPGPICGGRAFASLSDGQISVDIKEPGAAAIWDENTGWMCIPDNSYKHRRTFKEHLDLRASTLLAAAERAITATAVVTAPVVTQQLTLDLTVPFA